jgi:hypothetical protein
VRGLNVAKQSITQIPVPGNSALTPTGALQFQDDWPGLFIRGDDAIALLGELRYFDELLRQKCGAGLFGRPKEIMETIEQDVIVR